MEKYTKTFKNQNLNDLLLETLAWINFRWQKLIPNNKKWPLSKKYTVAEGIVVKVVHYSEFLPAYAKIIWGLGKKKWSLDLGSLIVPLTCASTKKRTRVILKCNPTHIPPSFVTLAHIELWILAFVVINQSEQICKWAI